MFMNFFGQKLIFLPDQSLSFKSKGRKDKFVEISYDPTNCRFEYRLKRLNAFVDLMGLFQNNKLPNLFHQNPSPLQESGVSSKD